MMAGPIVIKVYNNEGGYFVTFKKEHTVSTKEFCTDHGTISPYSFIPLIIRNNIVAVLPMISKYFLRKAASIPFLYNCPKQYPNVITLNHGSIG